MHFVLKFSFQFNNLSFIPLNSCIMLTETETMKLIHQDNKL